MIFTKEYQTRIVFAVETGNVHNNYFSGEEIYLNNKYVYILK